MRTDRNKAEELRKSGKSYKEIEKELGIPRATLSAWFSGEAWSADLREKLQAAAREKSRVRVAGLAKVRGRRLREAYEQARVEARTEFETLKYHPLFIAGMTLYWSAGTKAARNQVRFSGANPETIKIFITFLTRVCNVPQNQVKVALLSYPDADDPSIRRFWSFASGIPLSQFQTTVIVQKVPKVKRFAGGVCTVIVSSGYLRQKLGEWLNLLPKELMNGQYYENIS
ncbi:MAG TPA: hypothetical protein VEB18_01335 [Candidatus Paceibacterota bacterium]|nr:hypothetical protein [Candidatus Paceibacterota bacterium]